MTAPGDGGADDRLVRTTVDPGESVPIALLRAVAAVEGRRIENLPRLYDAIDPDALCELLADERFQGTVEFDYDDYHVAIDADRSIEVFEGDAE